MPNENSYQSLCRQRAASAEEQSAAQRQSGKAHKSESASPLGELNPECVFLRDTDLAMRYRVQRQTLWRWVAQGDFPKPVKLSPRCTRWRLSSVLEFERRRGGAA